MFHCILDCIDVHNLDPAAVAVNSVESVLPLSTGLLIWALVAVVVMKVLIHSTRLSHV